MNSRRSLPLLLVPLCLVTVLAGCHSRRDAGFKATVADDNYRKIATEIEYPVTQCSNLSEDWAALAPISLTSTEEPEYWDIRLEEAIQLTLAQSKVFRDLGEPSCGPQRRSRPTGTRRFARPIRGLVSMPP